MLKPLIVIGCGGSGVSTVRYLRKSAKKALADAGWNGPLPQAWQFIGVDFVLQGISGPEPIPAEDYVCSHQDVSYSSIHSHMRGKYPVGSSGCTDMLGWLPDARGLIPQTFQSHGLHRPHGRMAGLAVLMPQIEQRLSRSLDAIRNSEDEFCQLKELLGHHSNFGEGELDPYVVVVGSMSGGTGSGIMFDIHEVVRRLKPSWTSLISVVYSDSVFDSLTPASPRMRANSLTFMSELLALTWNVRKSSPLIERGHNFEYSGPPLTFIIENKNDENFALNAIESFQLVASWLTSVAISENEQFALAYAVSEQNPRSMINSGGYGFEKVSVHSTPGVVHALGHATISVGRDRFPEYASKLLQREVVEFLINGYQRIAIQEIGNSAATSPPEEIVHSLADKNLQKFLIVANLSTSIDLPNYLIDLVSSDAKIQSVRNSIQDNLGNAIKTNVLNDFDQVEDFNAAVQRVKKQTLQQNADLDLQIVGSWRLGVSEGISKALNTEVGNLSLPVVNTLLKTTRKLIGKTTDQFRILAEHLLESSGKHKPNLQTADSGPLNHAINSIVMEVTAQSLEYLAVELEDLANRELGDLIKQFEFLQTELAELLSSEIYSWPKLDDDVPNSFRPPSFEVCLESSDTWPKSIKRLILGPDAKDEDQDNDLMKIARSAIIQGGYETKNGGMAASFIRLINGALDRISLHVDLENHVLDWLMRQGSEFENFVGESLNRYLSEFVSPFSNEPIKNINHEERMKKYEEQLKSVLSICKPRIDIDHNLNALTYSTKNDVFHIFQLPFDQGHPAYEVSNTILANHLNNFNLPDPYFNSDGSITSAGITSYCKYPVNPSVMKHFTKTQAAFRYALGRGESEWVFKWPRTRTLSEFIPLPTELRHAAIRGFAVGRMLGYITIDTQDAIKISGKEREYAFPRFLMTKSGPNNLLPALLESMSLCFADIPELGQEAFGAYRELIGLGSTEQVPTYQSSGDEFLKFIQTGERLRIPVDIGRAERMSADTFEERTKKMLDYLELNLTGYVQIGERFNAMAATDPISAEDKLTLELLDELIENYQIVFDSIINYKKNLNLHGV